MTTDQHPYRKPVRHEEAISELRRCAGSQFDSLVVRAFLRTQSAHGRAEPRVLVTFSGALTNS